MPKILLTDISIRALKPPETGQATYWDKSLAGFGVRVSPGGTKTFVLVHGACGHLLLAHALGVRAEICRQAQRRGVWREWADCGDDVTGLKADGSKHGDL